MAAKPTLLLSPDGSWDANGPVQPTLTGGVLVVPGQYGNAWQLTDTSGTVTSSIPVANMNPGTAIVRARWDSVFAGVPSRAFGFGNSYGSVRFERNSFGEGMATVVGVDALSLGSIADGEWVTLAMSWTGGTLRTYRGGQMTGEATYGTVLNASVSTAQLVPWNGVVYVESILLFDTVLTDAEIAEYTAMDGAWTYNSTFRTHSGKIFTSYESGVFAMSAAVYLTDELNESREDISQFITGLQVNADADRTRSKFQCKVSAIKEVIFDGDWIAPYLMYTPEVGDEVVQQMGHYRLDIPSTSYDDTPAEYTEATGNDILELLSTMLLPATYYTARGTDVIQEVRALISMATRGWVGPNLVNNASFEGVTGGNLSVWNSNGTFSAGGSGTIQWVVSSNVDYPSGERAWGPTFGSMQPAGATASVYQTVGIAAHMIRQQAWLSGMFLPSHRDHRGYLKVDFYDVGGQLIVGKSWQTTPTIRTPGMWHREYAYGMIPENAITARITVAVIDAVGGSSTTRRSSWDDITFQPMFGTPIPESRIALPAIEAVASSRIQNTAGTSFLTAIDTLLEAAGLYDLMPMLDGRLTAGVDAQTSPTTIYTDRDARIIDAIEIDRDAGNRFNAVLAVKEDLRNGVFLSQLVVNNNPRDPWNIYGPLGQITERIVVQDAISTSALAAAARKKLKEASIQEALTMAVLPDFNLMLHDEILLETTNRANGIWTIRSLAWGTSDGDPLVKVSARRTVMGGSV